MMRHDDRAGSAILAGGSGGAPARRSCEAEVTVRDIPVDAGHRDGRRRPSRSASARRETAAIRAWAMEQG
jgi:hypothetical protein